MWLFRHNTQRTKNTAPITALDTLAVRLYNYSMNTTKATPKKTRAHFVLFCAGTPFKQKRVENKKAYNRQPKHKGREQ
jgi:hypothetical protein